MKYIKFGTYTGAENMQIDSDLLDEAIETQAQEPVFRLYAWKPRCISLGRNQKDDFLKGVNEDIVRRLTGGRALLHDDEITYSYVTPVSIVPNGETISASYKYISGILIDFFKSLSLASRIALAILTLNFASLYDLVGSSSLTNFSK